MNDILSKLKTNLTDKLPSNISKLLNESIGLSERGNHMDSLKSLSECLFLLLRDEYFSHEGLVYEEGMNVVDLLRELRNKGKDLGKSETDAILRIHEKAKLEDVDAIVLETCFEGAVTVFESFLRGKGSKFNEKVASSSRKSPGRFILEEIQSYFLESDTETSIKEHLPKIEEIYRDFSYDREIRKIYFQFLSEVDKERGKREILAYLESGEVTIHLGAVCIELLSEMGFSYDAKKMLGWYEEEFPNEIDGKYAELMVYLQAYLKDGRTVDKQRAESLSDIIYSNKESYYIYIENCYHIFTEREDAIRQKSEGLYLYKENIFKEKCLKIKNEKKGEEELKRREAELKKLEVEKERTTKEEIQKEVKPNVTQERSIDPSKNSTYKINTLEEFFTNSIGMEFILIPAGKFMMGAVPQDKEANDNQKPQHLVQITKPFYIGKYPVTQEEWEKVMGHNPSEFKLTTEGLIFKKIIKYNANHPVESINWNECHEFINKLSHKEGKTYRLPTEAEWEYSARGGFDSPTHSSIFHFGDDVSKVGEYAWHDNNSGNTTHPVGQKKPNPWGLYDTMGNVWEWCSDWYEENYYKYSPSIDPKGPSSGIGRIARGSSWYHSPKFCRTSLRDYINPSDRYGNLGFRIVYLPE